MEEFVSKQNYLYHLKHISAIKNGHSRPRLSQNKSNLGLISIDSLRQKPSSTFTNYSNKFGSKCKDQKPFSTRNKSTEEIMKNFLIQKQNLRLIERIGTMSSGINMRKFQKEYIENKRLLKFQTKVKKPKQFFLFRVFDIKFQQHAPDPEQKFRLYEVVKQRKKFITQGTIFQLRKEHIKTTKNQIHLLKIQGKLSGVVNLTMNCFLPIKNKKQEIGNLIIDIL